MAEYTSQERAAVAVFRLASRRPLTAKQLAALSGSSVRTAQRTLAGLGRVLPVYRDDDTGAWRLVE